MFIYRAIIVTLSVLLGGSILLGQPESQMSFTLSLEKAKPAKFHVQFQYEGALGRIQDFKMPSIAPGYYRVLDFAANVENFKAVDGNGKSLPWAKIAKNTWRVGTDGTESVRIDYEVKSVMGSVADSFIDGNRAYISTPSVFMYPDGGIQHPVTVTLDVSSDFPKTSTGLEAVPGKRNRFIAKNFDILYDCPIYLGNPEIIHFDVQGIAHQVVMENPGSFDREPLKKGLEKVIRTATQIIGDIPYKHYTFIFMGKGRGGLEHRNSTAVFLDVSGDRNPWLEKDIMKFLTHEYFHLYNVKSIRPIALEPFNYDGKNTTDMLWLSEGGTVYYEFIVLNRAGYLNRSQCLDSFSAIITKHENNPARFKQSVAEASLQAWTQSFFGNDKEISYYDKGFILSMVLDLIIRHETENKKSLDDVMRNCYFEYFKKRQRGFTGLEFRQECETVAGKTLTEFFNLISNTKEIPYDTYLAYAGLTLEVKKDKKTKSTFTMKRVSNPTSLQNKIFNDWLKE